MSKQDYVFKDDGGELKLVADFDGYYRNEENPWGQNGNTDEEKQFYDITRTQLVDAISMLREASNDNSLSIHEIGCGLGYVLDHVNRTLKIKNELISGSDISLEAIKRAKKLFPQYSFLTQDICIKNFVPATDARYKCLVLGQVLWYIIEHLEDAFHNMISMIKEEGYLVVTAGFFGNQKYGKDVINGPDGFMHFYLNTLSDSLKLIHFNIDYSCSKLGYPAVFVFQKKS